VKTENTAKNHTSEKEVKGKVHRGIRRVQKHKTHRGDLIGKETLQLACRKKWCRLSERKLHPRSGTYKVQLMPILSCKETCYHVSKPVKLCYHVTRNAMSCTRISFASTSLSNTHTPVSSIGYKLTNTRNGPVGSRTCWATTDEHCHKTELARPTVTTKQPH
jgi:hypothetical protein